MLRRGIGKMPGDIPELWNILFDGLPEELMSKVGDPSYAEWSIYTALTLYALHQQGLSLMIRLPLGYLAQKKEMFYLRSF